VEQVEESLFVAEPLARIYHHPSTVDAEPLAVTRRTPSSQFDVVSATPSLSSASCASSQRRFDALATNCGEKCGLAPLAIEAIQQLAAYFDDARFRFDLPLLMVGSEFQQAVWRQLQQINPGQVKSYGEIAKELSSSPRAVGGACRANPLPIVIPCHRVVARNGVGGYGGATAGHKLQQKLWLLAHEGVRF
jgi:methylated-DNA-[protein]-cysteine S-methyltransferase